jgi:hypothetical protein
MTFDTILMFPTLYRPTACLNIMHSLISLWVLNLVNADPIHPTEYLP